MRTAIVFLSLLVAAPALSATEVISGTQTWPMRSKESGREYQIYLAMPPKPAPDAGYAVVYTLDANIMFGTMVEAVRSIERRPASGATVVVGIGYPAQADPVKERAIDLTPSVTADPPKGSGGAEAFLRFVTQELQPEMRRRLKIDADRETLFGHSFGGLFVLYTLINQPASFDNFVAASPSIWFENRMLQKGNVRNRLSAKLATTQAAPRVLITVGEYEQAADPDFSVHGWGPPLKTLLERGQVDTAREFTAFLSQEKGIENRLIVLEGEDHGTVIAPAIGRAARFALSPMARAPEPATRVTDAQVAPGGIPIPDAAAYLALSPDERYQLRVRVRALEEAERIAWNTEFQRRLSAALTYGQHRRLHEERVAMDARHGTQPPPEG